MDATRAACAMSCAVADREPSANRGIACARCQMSAFQTESSRQLVFVRWDTYTHAHKHTFWNWCITIPVRIGNNADLAVTLMLHPVITVILFYCKMETFEQSEHNCVYFWVRFFFFVLYFILYCFVLVERNGTTIYLIVSKMKKQHSDKKWSFRTSACIWQEWGGSNAMQSVLLNKTVVLLSVHSTLVVRVVSIALDFSLH